MFCPRCKTETSFYELDEGPDSYEDDIFLFHMNVKNVKYTVMDGMIRGMKKAQDGKI